MFHHDFISLDLGATLGIASWPSVFYYDLDDDFLDCGLGLVLATLFNSFAGNLPWRRNLLCIFFLPVSFLFCFGFDGRLTSAMI